MTDQEQLAQAIADTRQCLELCRRGIASVEALNADASIGRTLAAGLAMQLERLEAGDIAGSEERSKQLLVRMFQWNERVEALAENVDGEGEEWKSDS